MESNSYAEAMRVSMGNKERDGVLLEGWKQVEESNLPYTDVTLRATNLSNVTTTSPRVRFRSRLQSLWWDLEQGKRSREREVGLRVAGKGGGGSTARGGQTVTRACQRQFGVGVAGCRVGAAGWWESGVVREGGGACAAVGVVGLMRVPRCRRVSRGLVLGPVVHGQWRGGEGRGMARWWLDEEVAGGRHGLEVGGLEGVKGVGVQGEGEGSGEGK
jgi:hypothetical protein